MTNKEKNIITVTRGCNMWRPMVVNGNEVNNIVIYKNGKELFKLNCGFFEMKINNFLSKDIIAFKISEPVKAIKLNLNRNDNFYMLDKENFERYQERKYILYINEKEIKINKIYESLLYQNEFEKNFILTADLTFVYSCKTKEKEYKNITVNSLGVTRRETTEKGERFNELLKDLEDKKIKINSYELKQMLKYYDLVKKEV